MARWTLDAARIAKLKTTLRKNHRSPPIRVGFDNLLDRGLISGPEVVPRERAAVWFRADILHQAAQITKTNHQPTTAF